MPLLLRRTAAQKSSLRSPEAMHGKASGTFDPIRGGRLPPRAPPPKLRRMLFNRRVSRQQAAGSRSLRFGSLPHILHTPRSVLTRRHVGNQNLLFPRACTSEITPLTQNGPTFPQGIEARFVCSLSRKSGYAAFSRVIIPGCPPTRLHPPGWRWSGSAVPPASRRCRPAPPAAPRSPPGRSWRRCRRG